MSATPKDINKKTSIYVLRDPDTNEIRYVGKTVCKLKKRLQEHVAAITGKVNHRTNWIKSIIVKDKIPIIEEIDSCKWCESQERERYWIKYYRDLGLNLVNETDGGEGNLGRIRPKEEIKKMRETLKKKLKPVYQYDLNGNFIKKWDSTLDIIDELGYLSAGLSRCLNGNRKKYKDFIWSYKEITPEKYTRKKTVPQKGHKHSYLSSLIKLEETLLKNKNIFLFKDNELLYEAISLVNMVYYCLNNKIFNGDKTIASYKSFISEKCKSGKLFGEYLFTYKVPKNHKLRKSYIFSISLLDENNNKLETIEGLDEFCNILKLNKKNVINNMKGITKFLIKNDKKYKIQWEIIQNIKELQLE